MRYDDKVSKQTRVNKRNVQLEHGFSSEIMNAEDKWKPESNTQNNGIAQRLTCRKITLENGP